jgi:membrane-associated phospholipid phosphatase
VIRNTLRENATDIEDSSLRPEFSDRGPVLLMLAGAAVVLLGVVYLLAVRTTWGQRLDATALSGRGALRPRTIDAASQLLDTISVASLFLVGGLIVLIALARRRPFLSLGAAVVIAGSCISTELLKHVFLPRPNLGITDPIGHAASFPSGHTTVAFSLAMAALLVAPSRYRSLVGIVGALYAIGVGVAVVATANHRPSDPIGAVLVVTAWVATVAAALQMVSVGTPRDKDDRRVSPALALGGAALLAFSFVGLVTTSLAIKVDRLGTVELSGAFAGACAAFTGAVLVALASLLWCLRGVSLDPPDDEIILA